ncbi:MAG TPA: hypothetical protein ENN53_02730 [Candidatus Acetothermia bacterium]|nr:hypothetical protein [Candidatus Acetothermia bacterium]
MGQRLATIPGFGKTSVAELAGEIGTGDRFASEASLALYGDYERREVSCPS